MKNLCSIFLLLFVFTNKCLPQAATIFRIDKLSSDGILLDKGWKFHVGDDPAYANAHYDDKAWKTINPALDIYDLPQIPRSGIVWFRLHLSIDSSLFNQLVLIIQQSGASEIYLDGKLIHHFGTISADKERVKAYDPLWKPVSLPMSKSTQHVLAVRFACQPNIRYTTMFETNNHALWIQIKDVESGVSFYHQQVSRFIWFHIIIIGVCFLFCILHFAFYLFYPSQKANFYFAMFALFYVTANVLQRTFYLEAHEIKYKFFLANFSFTFFMVGNLFLLTAIHYLPKQKKDIYYWSLIVYVIISFFLNAGPYRWGWLAGGVLAQNLIQFNILRISLLALRKKRRGTLIIVAGAILYSISFVIFLAQGKLVNVDTFLTISTLRTVFFNMFQLSIPMAVSIFLGLEFAFVNDTLQQKLKEVNELSDKNLTQEREKQEILTSQNVILESRVHERTAALSQSLKELKETQNLMIQQEKMASLGELTAGIAHEIQNPLNFVNNFSEVNKELLTELKDEIEKGNLNDVKAIATNVIENEEKINHYGKRADGIVKGMLQHSRSSSGVKEPTNINALADEYLRLAFHGFRAKDRSFDATMKTDFDATIGNINIIPQDIGRVILNLINNAFYAVAEKKKQLTDGLPHPANYEPTISVSTKKANARLDDHPGRDIVEIKVADNGNGIPQKVLDKIFQPFFTTKPTGQGTGLGLSLSYDIVRAHGGELKVETEENKGSTFVIILPC